MDQLKKLVAGLSIAQRISIVLAALAVVGGMFAFAHWKHEGDFRPLYSGMAPEDAATVVQKLKESGVEYRLADNGGAVLVPSASLAESRLALAAAGLPKTGRIGFELFDKANFGATEFVEHVNYSRALEGELERSVMSLAEVEQARIHLTLPKDSVFLDQQQPAKASVMVKLRPGSRISAQNVMAVTHLVASAVEGLSPDAVSVVDMDGNLLARPRKAGTPDASEMTSESLQVRQQMERGLVSKISETLEPLLGTNGFRAGASVDCDLTSADEQAETLDPTRSVMVSSQKTEDSTERASTSGIPGTASNLPNPGPAKSTPTGLTRRTEDITYQTSRVIRHTRIPQGVIKRMSLAVLVNQNVRWEGAGAQKRRVLVPPAPETLKTIKDLVAGVTGLSAERGDQLIVETLPFESSLNAEPPQSAPVTTPGPATKSPAWQEFYLKHKELITPIAIALVLLVGVAITVAKRMRKRRPPVNRADLAEELEGPAVVTQLQGSTAAAQLAPGSLAGRPLTEAAGPMLMERVRELVKREPDAGANVVRMWLEE